MASVSLSRAESDQRLSLYKIVIWRFCDNNEELRSSDKWFDYKWTCIQ